ncbi:DUF2202 domain-containing protein [Actinobacillus pleuropneumoniae]|uniref:DUF2202 domain-containing protein n=1 Tax=Actinobacillus pleuropneumoniae TaxID=715 RepID=UPI003F7BC922
MKNVKLMPMLMTGIVTFSSFSWAAVEVPFPNRSTNIAAKTTASVLSREEIDSLRYMREEEKLAHDVYIHLYNRWKTPVFLNIAHAEKIHTQAVANLLHHYQVTDSIPNETGKFNHPELQKLYGQLTQQGEKSLMEALKVGMLIEDLDIADLQKAQQTVTQNDIKMIYQFLEKGSRNHLRGFYRNLRQIGGDYQPQYITQTYFNRVVSSGIERGRSF